jgi:hypothetical protein
MIRNRRETIGRIACEDWTMRAGIGLSKAVAVVFCNVLDRRNR